MADQVNAVDLPALLKALEPFLKVEKATHKGRYTDELEDNEYISVYHFDIKVSHFRALKKALYNV